MFASQQLWLTGFEKSNIYLSIYLFIYLSIYLSISAGYHTRRWPHCGVDDAHVLSEPPTPGQKLQRPGKGAPGGSVAHTGQVARKHLPAAGHAERRHHPQRHPQGLRRRQGAGAQRPPRVSLRRRQRRGTGRVQEAGPRQGLSVPVPRRDQLRREPNPQYSVREEVLVHQMRLGPGQWQGAGSLHAHRVHLPGLSSRDLPRQGSQESRLWR